MAAVKIASLFAEIGFKVDTKALNAFQVRLVGLKTRLNQLTTAINKSETALAGGLRNQILASKLQAQQANTIAAQYRQQAAAANAMAAQARAAAAQARATTRRQHTGGRARITSSGMDAGVAMRLPIGEAALAAGLYGVGTSFINANIEMDKFRAGLLASTGSAEEAGRQFSWLQNVSEQLGTSFSSSRSQFMMFSATASSLGYGTNQIRNMYYEIAKGQSALGMSQDDAEGMTRALTQMLSKGKVMSEELKGQLAERVPGAVAIMAKAITGGDIPKLFKMMEDGALESKDAVWKFLQVMNSTEGMRLAAEAQSKGLQAYFNRLSNAWQNMMDKIGQSGGKRTVQLVLSGLTEAIKWFTEVGVPKLDTFFNILNGGVEKISSVVLKMWEFRDAIQAVAVVTAIAAVAMFIFTSGGVSGAIARLVAPMLAFAGSVWAAVAPMLPLIAMFALLFVVLGAVYLVIQDIYNYFQGGDSAIAKAANQGNTFAMVLMDIADAAIWLYDALMSIANFQWPRPPDWWLKVVDMASQGIEIGAGMLGAVTDKVAGGLSDLGNWATGASPVSAALTPGQGTVLANNQNKNVTFGDIYVNSAQEGKQIVGGAVDGDMSSSYGNAASHT